MPIEFSFSEADYDIHTRISGPVHERDLFDYLDAVVTHEDYRPGSSALIECDAVRLVDVNREAIRRFAGYTKDLESRLAGSNVAVVTSQPLVFSLALTYRFLRKPPYRFSVFRSEADARRWLAQPSA